MYTKILYPTDFSACSEKALEYVKKLKECGNEEVIVLHVIDEREIRRTSIVLAWVGEAIEEYEEKVLHEMMRDAEEKLNTVKEELERTGLKTDIRLVKGIPSNEIVKTSNTEDVSLIVIGSHGRSNIKEILLGSVSENVTRKSEKPVLVVKM